MPSRGVDLFLWRRARARPADDSLGFPQGLRPDESGSSTCGWPFAVCFSESITRPPGRWHGAGLEGRATARSLCCPLPSRSIPGHGCGVRHTLCTVEQLQVFVCGVTVFGSKPAAIHIHRAGGHPVAFRPRSCLPEYALAASPPCKRAFRLAKAGACPYHPKSNFLSKHRLAMRQDRAARPAADARNRPVR